MSFEAHHLLVEGSDLCGFGNLRHDHDVGAPAHDRCKIGATLGFERIHLTAATIPAARQLE